MMQRSSYFSRSLYIGQTARLSFTEEWTAVEKGGGGTFLITVFKFFSFFSQLGRLFFASGFGKV